MAPASHQARLTTLMQINMSAHRLQGQFREAEIANSPFLAALAGALRRCSSLVWLATRRSERLALHPASAPKNGILAISASLSPKFLPFCSH